MKKTDLITMTVTELKALAKKKKITVPSGAKKAAIVAAIGAALSRAIGKTVKAVKTSAKRAAAVKSPLQKKRQKAPAPAVPEREWKLPPGTEEPLIAQERVSESKYYTGSVRPASVSAHEELPQGYGEEKIALMTRDPFVAFAYWEATPARIEREKAWLGWDSKLCVRMYDITGVLFDGRNALGYFDQEVFERCGDWYFDLGRPSHSFCADLGLLSPDGKFLTLARSNYITMPRNGVSEVIDEEWMLVDEEFWKLYGYPEGFRRGVSSPEMQEMLKRRRMLEISSPGLFSRERAKRK